MSSAGKRIEGHLHLVRALMGRDGCGAEEALDKLIAAQVVPGADRQEVIDGWEAQRSTPIRVLRPAVLAEAGPKAWFSDWDPASGYYWPRLRRHLAHGLNRRDFEIDTMDLATDLVLSHLADPRPQGPAQFDIRGLVLGHVQSGKTGNISALIAKAADVGYKVVIVLSGMQNGLRRQTQLRLQAELGHPRTEGVGEPDPGLRWVWMTTAELSGDFQAKTAQAVLQGNEQVIMVVKKNTTPLGRLIEWLDGAPARVPALIIDDEADQASINTGGNRQPQAIEFDGEADDNEEPVSEELDPSRINSQIRRLLNVFHRCSYVAYTATPFANILIDPEALDHAAGADLYPRDFIVALPAPPPDTYVGGERIFGRDTLAGDGDEPDADGLDVVELVPRADVRLLLPPPGGLSTFVPAVPDSLRRALVDFVLASAGRLAREEKAVACTMLVHTDHRKVIQGALATDIQKHLAEIRQLWRYEREQIRPEFHRRWEESFRRTIVSLDARRDMAFGQIEEHIDEFMRSPIEVRLLNSDTMETLDFDAEPELRAVLVGGNKLSRGLTIEGLLVAYYVRDTPYYDTLLQMSRWFGYRGGYVDLTRLYSTPELVRNFHDLATIEEELRRDIMRYQRQKLTPLQFRPRIRSHAFMLPTAKKKMRDHVADARSYDGRLIQTLRYRFDDMDWLRRNLETTRAFLSGLDAPAGVSRGRPYWENVEADAVLRYLARLDMEQHAKFDIDSLLSYIESQRGNGELVRWRVLVCAADGDRSGLGTEDLGVRGFGDVATIARTRLITDPDSVGVITDPDDETFGLPAEDITDAQERFAEREFPTRGDAYRAMRPPSEGLLLIYPISRHSRPRSETGRRRQLFDDGQEGCTVVGVAVSFPASESAATVEYVTGRGPVVDA